MKVLGIEMTKSTLEVFELWCKITGYPLKESSFKAFIEDALINDGYSFSNVHIYYDRPNTELRCNFANNDFWIFSIGIKKANISCWIEKLHFTLKELENDVKA